MIEKLKSLIWRLIKRVFKIIFYMMAGLFALVMIWFIYSAYFLGWDQFLIKSKLNHIKETQQQYKIDYIDISLASLTEFDWDKACPKANDLSQDSEESKRHTYKHRIIKNISGIIFIKAGQDLITLPLTGNDEDTYILNDKSGPCFNRKDIKIRVSDKGHYLFIKNKEYGSK